MDSVHRQPLFLFISIVLSGSPSFRHSSSLNYQSYYGFVFQGMNPNYFDIHEPLLTCELTWPFAVPILFKLDSRTLSRHGAMLQLASSMCLRHS